MPRTKSPKTNGVKEAVTNPETQPTAQVAGKQVGAASATPVLPTEPVTKVEAKSPQSQRSASLKPEGARAEQRNNVVPINLDDEIRKLAYLRAERRGFAPGYENEDWLAAEHEVLQRYRQHTAQSA